MAKNQLTRILVCLLICGVATSFRPASLEDIISSQVGVSESPKGSNWGPEVKKYLSHTNTKIPAPWCAAFVRFCLDSAGIASTINAYSPTAHNKNNIVFHRGRWQKQPEVGDVFTIYYVAMNRIAHTGFYYRSVNSAICETVEGNTAIDGGREGIGVFRRKRSFHSLYSITRWH